jgi:NADH:ubiquinone oxidoreductase subunit 5 (subunit L)/multisubunit Na+/H+ antiporter MnhA subunit/multisubunit Na+/H+ antiporter MnhB subunit
MLTALLIAVFGPLAWAALLPALGRRLGPATGWVALVAPVVSTALLVAVLLNRGEAAGPLTVEWIPALGIDLAFLPDGLGLFYGLVVAGVGVLVVFYAANYIDGHYRDHGKFYAYLLIFMSAMLATVLSGNLMTLFVAWELTGLASFLLIGFLHEEKKSAYGARMALLTTGLTGLALLVGVVLLGQVYGTYDLARILAAPVPPEKAGLLSWAFVFCAIGIFGKSAQFPFFYWLPNAMAAPTPVSAYLHSATMVKLGVFLTARLLPCFDGLPEWTPVLVLFGFSTMLLGAVLAVVSHDLKAVLAYSTVSQLGLLVGHYGLFAAGAPVQWDYVHILNHTFYKACLFMVVGIIDHATGTRDLRRLGGLFRLMPVTGVAAAIGLAAMAGLPFTTGFLSKEMLLKAIFGFWQTNHALADFAVAAVVVASLLKVVFAWRVFHAAFLGAPTEAVKAHWHAPSLGLQAAPALLAGAALVFGVAAGAFGRLGDLFAVPGLHAAAEALHLWHGFTPELLTSAGIVAGGFALHAVLHRLGYERLGIPRILAFDAGFERLVDRIPAFGQWTIRLTQADRPLHYQPVVIGVVLALGGAWTWHAWDGLRATLATVAPWPDEVYGYHRFFVVVLVAGALGALLTARGWVTQLLALSVVGFLVSFYFVLAKAPDLALTQILVETASLLLVLMFIMRLKRAGRKATPSRDSRTFATVRAVLAVGAGLAAAGAMLLFQGAAGPARIGDQLLARSLPEAKGANAVNTTLIDFRGLDTFFEILVLLIATLGCLGLLMRRRADRPPRPAAEPRDGDAREVTPIGDSYILTTVVAVLFFMINVFAVYLFFRGHNAPGGGFIAGLCTGISFVMLGFVQGIERLHRLLQVEPVRLAVFGLLLAAGTGLLPLLAGDAFFQHYHPYLKGVPLLGDVYIGTPVFFDLGVYLLVVGITLKIVFPLAKSIHGFRAFIVEEERSFAAADEEPVEPEAQPVRRGGEGGRP